MSDQATAGRRTFLAASAAALTSTVPLIATTNSHAARHRPPNVLLVVTDDQPRRAGWGIPSVVRLVGRQGVTFASAYATTPLCGPSRASILTGQYAHNHGVLANRRPAGLDHRRALPRYLREHGYRTGIFGKYLNAWDIRRPPRDFDEYAIMHPPAYERARWNLNGLVTRLDGYSTALVRDFALDFLARDDGRPWFLYLAPYGSHRPFQPEPKYARLEPPEWPGNPAVASKDRKDKPPYVRRARTTITGGRRIRAGQLRTLRSVDDMVRDVWQLLATTGRLENTLVIFISDNGYCWGDHGWSRKGVPYGPAVGVPLYMSWPAGGLAGGRVDRRLVANIDVLPTILDAAGIKPWAGHRMDGRSVLRPRGRRRLLLEFWQEPGKLATEPPTWASIITRDMQYVEYYDTVADDRRLRGSGDILFRELYDLRRDPYQLENLLHRARPRQRRKLDVHRLSAQLHRDRRR